MCNNNDVCITKGDDYRPDPQEGFEGLETISPEEWEEFRQNNEELPYAPETPGSP